MPRKTHPRTDTAPKHDDAPVRPAPGTVSALLTLDNDLAPSDVSEVAATDAPEAQTEQGNAFQFSAPAARRKVQPAAVDLPKICASVYVLVSTGSKGKLDTLPLHEIPLLRRKILLQEPSSEVPKVLAEFPEHLDRLRPKTAPELREEYQRLSDRYVFEKPNSNNGEMVNLLADFYGNGLAGMRSAMLRLEQGYRQIKSALGPDEVISDDQMEELAAIADPDFDIGQAGGGGDIPYQQFEPGQKGSGYVVAGT